MVMRLQGVVGCLWVYEVGYEVMSIIDGRLGRRLSSSTSRFSPSRGRF